MPVIIERGEEVIAQVREKKQRATYVCLCVTAMRARAMSSGYVNIDAVVPASDPAINRYTGGT